MEIKQAAAVLKELGHPIRLTIIKELIKYSKNGLAVGELQKILQIPNSTLSHHISSLVSAGLVEQKRDKTTLFCISNNKLVHAVSVFLLEECCSKYNQ